MDEIPVNVRKRRDLKPGTVFQYQSDADYTFYVPPVAKDGPLTWDGKRLYPSDLPAPSDYDEDCIVIWESPPEKPANPKQAFGDKKLATWAVPPALTLGAAKAFGEGAAKYGAFNWRESHVEAMTYVGAILRHLYAYMDGEDVDPESATGKLHLEGIAACVGILLDCTYGGFLVDNRPPKGPAPALVLTPKEKK